MVSTSEPSARNGHKFKACCDMGANLTLARCLLLKSFDRCVTQFDDESCIINELILGCALFFQVSDAFLEPPSFVLDGFEALELIQKCLQSAHMLILKHRDRVHVGF